MKTQRVVSLVGAIVICALPASLFASDENASLSAAKENGWVVVSINNDWKSVFKFSDK
jgi:hypothetical protein